MSEIARLNPDPATKQGPCAALVGESFHAATANHWADAGRMLGTFARELLFKPYSPGLWCAFGMLLGCGKSPSGTPLSQETTSAAYSLGVSADAVSSAVSIERLQAEYHGGPEQLRVRLAQTVLGKSALDTDYANFTNALSREIVELERAGNQASKE